MNSTVPDRLEWRLTEMTAELDGIAGTDVLMLMFHSLTGIGGTHGFPRVSEISHTCETMCATAMESNRPLLPEEKISLHLSIAEIRGIVA